MAELVQIKYEDAIDRKLIGVVEKAFDAKVTMLWRKYFNNGVAKIVDTVDDKYKLYDNKEYIALGCMTNFDEDGNFDYLIGKFYALDAPVPKGLMQAVMPKTMTAKIKIKGEYNDIVKNAYDIIMNELSKEGYEVADIFYLCDVYTYDGYNKTKKFEGDTIIDYIIPCKKIEN